MYYKFKYPDIVTGIKICRLEYFGLVVGMDGERSVKTLMEGTAGEGRIKGLRWTDNVELDLGNIVLKNWRS